MILDHLPKDGKIYSRIVSVVPSQTELLAYFGLNEEVIAITKFCVHPEKWFRSKKRIGGTKNLHLDEIINFQPDLIIANKEENTKEDIETLAEKFDVWVTEVDDLDGAVNMISDLGLLTGKGVEAGKLVAEIKAKFATAATNTKKIPAAYLIWNSPLMTVGADTFIHDMMKHAGLENVFADKLRYPEVLIEDIKNSGCDCLLLSTEPYPFSQKHIENFEAELPGIKVLLVDGEMFSWYGSRLLLSADYFQELHKKISSFSNRS